MKFDEFTACVVDSMKVRMLQDNEEVVIKTNKVLKNNGVELTALNLCRSSDEVCPTIYLEPFYREYMGGKDYDDVIDDVYRLHRRRCGADGVRLEKVMDENNVMDNIILRIINRERNEKLLSDAPYVEFKDLAIVFRRVVELRKDGIATTLVSNSDMKRWRVSIDTMYKKGLENTERMFPALRKSLFDVIQDRYNSFDPDIGDCTGELYILTNSYGINGATAVLYPGMLESCAELVDDDIYVLPSSVHELLFIGAGAGYTEEYLSDLVREANLNAVSEMDFLSDNIYLYSRKEGVFRQI